MIKAECIAASRGKTKIATFLVTMPRYILAEFNTHRVFTRNSASSRAIRTEKMLQMLLDNPFMPVAWQKDHTGMQGTEYFEEEMFGEETSIPIIQAFQQLWLQIRNESMVQSGVMRRMGLTKQLANRILEPYMWHTVLVTATEWDNFFNLRCPKYDIGDGILYKSRRDAIIAMQAKGIDTQTGELFTTTLEWLKINKGQADIHMSLVAEAIYDAYQTARFENLHDHEWHIPYGAFIDNQEVTRLVLENSDFAKKMMLPKGLTTLNWETMQRAKVMISVARCARLSYKTLGDNPKIDYKADFDMYHRLRNDQHWSPFEHVAYAMGNFEWDECVKTIINSKGAFEKQKGWLANYRGWVQERALLENAA